MGRQARYAPEPMSLRRSTRCSSFAVLQLSDGEASAEVCPARGALVTDFSIGNEHVLFLDASTVADSTKSVRGGVPCWFPDLAAGSRGSPPMSYNTGSRARSRVDREDGDRLADRAAALVDGRHPREVPSRISDRLHAAARARAAPAPRVGDSQPFVEGHADAASVRAAPLLHRAASIAKAPARVETSATRAWNTIARAAAPSASPPAFGGDEIDFHLLDHETGGTTLNPWRFSHTDSAALVERAFTSWCCGRSRGKPFVCVEPWSAPSLAARAGAPLPMLAANASETYSFSISLG